jgi:thiamine biosynthesis lipoprotein
MIARAAALVLTLGAAAELSAIAAQERERSSRPAPSALDDVTRTSQTQGTSVLREWQGGVMGTNFQLEAIGTDAAELDRVLGLALDELRRVEDVFTVVARVGAHPPQRSRRSGAGAGQPGNGAAARDLGRVRTRDDGAFDVTYFPLRPLWNYKAEHPTLPTEEQIQAALKFVDYRQLVVDREGSTVELPPGFSIDLGGIAKGYGIDRAMDVLLANGVKNALVQAGGDTKALGRKFDKPWQIAIKNPRHKDEVFAVLPVVNQCVQTSGDYERFFEIDGKRYHHIVDPRTGRPSEGCMSATVIGPEATFDDGIATAMCVLGRRPAWP